MNLVLHRENHPRLDLGNLKIDANKIILGSFPSFGYIKNSTFVEDRVSNTPNQRIMQVPFFFGTRTNRFWHWYKSFLDQTINIQDADSLCKSLLKNNIGITDLILSCDRKGTSSLDKDLINRKYNHAFFRYPAQNKTLKLLCTSKGLMNEMLLNNHFFKRHPSIKIDDNLSQSLQRNFLTRVNGFGELIQNPICCVLQVENGGHIECLAIPSPGSPYRKLENFGCNGDQIDNYLNVYLRETFQWFCN